MWLLYGLGTNYQIVFRYLPHPRENQFWCGPITSHQGLMKQSVVFLKIIRNVRKLVTFELWIIGVNKDANLDFISRICEELQIVFRHWPFLNYEKMLNLLAHCAVGVDIIDEKSNYNNAKSFGKVLAYIRSGTAVVATNTAEYPHFFKSGLNGFIANDLEQWVDSISTLLLNETFREQIAQCI